VGDETCWLLWLRDALLSKPNLKGFVSANEQRRNEQKDTCFAVPRQIGGNTAVNNDLTVTFMFFVPCFPKGQLACLPTSENPINGKTLHKGPVAHVVVI